MLKELTRDDWLGILNLPASRIPRVLILRGTRNFKTQHQAMLPFFDDVMEVGTSNGIIDDVFIGQVRGHAIAFACVYGGSMASEIVHVFGTLGTRTVIQIGNCGAIADEFQTGDLLLIQRAFCGEGAAQYYQPGKTWIDASSELLPLASQKAGPHRVGTIYTTAALFAEGMDDIERWYREGFAAVDMESAATFAVAEYFGMQRLAMAYAFDNPRQREHLLLSDTEKDVRRSEANEVMKRLAIELAVEWCT